MFDLYKIKVDTFKAYLGHANRMCLIYLLWVGGLMQFAFSEGAGATQRYMNLGAVLIFCVWAERMRRVHEHALHRLKTSLDELSSALGFHDHVEDGASFVAFAKLLASVNLLVILGVLVLLLYSIATGR